MARTLHHWQALCGEIGGPNAWIKVAKYKLGAFFSHWTHQPIPKSPFSRVRDHPGVLLGGRAYKFVRRTVEKHGKSFLQSVGQLKRSFPRPPKSFVDQEVASTFAKLTRPKPVERMVRLRDWGDPTVRPGQFYHITKDIVVMELRRTVDELFNRATYTMQDRIRPFFPSTSANYVNSRSGGGAVGYIMNDPELLLGLRTYGFSREIIRPVRRGLERVANGELGAVVDHQAVERRFATLWLRLLKTARMEDATVHLVGLSEALKARVISKGPPATYTVLKPLQQKMWQVLSKHPCFKLTGQPVDEKYVQERLGRSLSAAQAYLSGDYSDATNEIHSWVSEAICRRIADVLKLSFVERTLFERALTGHEIAVPGFKQGGSVATRPQRSGQLMGSIVSFPILCIANAALTRFALEQAVNRRMSLRDAPMMINGDDVAAKTTPLGRELWAKITGFCGLAESIGKTYYSREFVQINSRNFERCNDVAEEEDGLVFSETKFVNLALAYGLKRSDASGGSKISHEDAFAEGLGSIGSRFQALREQAPKWLRSRVLDLALEENRSVLERVHVPWFMPTYLGGLGLPPFSVKKNGKTIVRGPSDLDLAKAKSIKLNWERRRPVTVSGERTWHMRKLTEKTLKDFGVPEVEVGEEEERDVQSAVSTLTIAQLFDADYSFEDLYRPENPSLSALRHNERLWKNAAPLGGADPTLIFTEPQRKAYNVMKEEQERVPTVRREPDPLFRPLPAVFATRLQA